MKNFIYKSVATDINELPKIFTTLRTKIRRKEYIYKI